MVYSQNIVLSNYLYAPKLRRNEISSRQQKKKKKKKAYKKTFIRGRGKISVCNKNGKVEFIEKRMQGLYFVFPKYKKRMSLKDWI